MCDEHLYEERNKRNRLSLKVCLNCDENICNQTLGGRMNNLRQIPRAGVHRLGVFFCFLFFIRVGGPVASQAQLQVVCDTMSSINIWDFMLYVIYVSRETFYVKQGSSAIPDGA